MKAFEETVAATCGVNAALLFSHIKYWTDKNMKAGKNIHNGKAWMYDTHEKFHASFPYLSTTQINRALGSLFKHGYILKGNFNKTKYDRTVWYSVSDTVLSSCNSENTENPPNDAFCENAKSILRNRKTEIANTQNGDCEIATPIPNIIPDKEQTNTQNIIFSDDEKKDAPSINPFQKEAKEVLVSLGKKREPTQHELSLYSKWRTEYYISHEVILRSCELTGGANGPSFSYLSKVMDTLHSEHICDIREYESYKAEKERHEKFCNELFARMGESRKPSLTQRLRIKQFADEYNLNHDILNMCADRARDKPSPFEALCRMASTLRSAGITDFYEARDYIDRINNQSSSQGTGYGSPDGYMRHRYTAEELARIGVNLDEE